MKDVIQYFRDASRPRLTMPMMEIVGLGLMIVIASLA